MRSVGNKKIVKFWYFSVVFGRAGGYAVESTQRADHDAPNTLIHQTYEVLLHGQNNARSVCHSCTPATYPQPNDHNLFLLPHRFTIPSSRGAALPREPLHQRKTAAPRSSCTLNRSHKFYLNYARCHTSLVILSTSPIAQPAQDIDNPSPSTHTPLHTTYPKHYS